MMLHTEIKPIVFVKDDHLVTTSIAFASYFNLTHCYVLKLIQNTQLSPTTKQVVFELKRDMSRDGRELLSYYIAEDGVLMLISKLRIGDIDKRKWQYLQAFDNKETGLSINQEFNFISLVDEGELAIA